MNISSEQKYIDCYLSLTEDLLSHELVDGMKQYHHHKKINTHFHSVYVSYRVMKTCSLLGVKNMAPIVRAALLHDFYLYEWYTEKHEEYHIFYHPKQSVKNIEQYFGKLSKMQRNMILSHMWPTYVERPRYLASWLLTFSDKACAMEDYVHTSKRFLPVYEEIDRRVHL